MITKLTFDFNDPAVIRMLRLLGYIINSWLQRAFLTAFSGVPPNLTLKRHLLFELYEYEPFHAVGDYKLFCDAPNNFGLPEDDQILRK